MRVISLAVLLCGCGSPTTSLLLHADWSGITVDQLHVELTQNGTALIPPTNRPDTAGAALTSGAELEVLLNDSLAGSSVHVAATVRDAGKDVDSVAMDVMPVLHTETTVTMTFGMPITPVTPTLVITPQSPTVNTNGTVKLQAMLTDMTGTRDVSAMATWTTDAATVASVMGGTVTGHAAGMARITSVASGLTATTNVTVTVGPKQLTSIDCAPASIMLLRNFTQQLTMTGHYSDSSTADLTSMATYMTADMMTATVNPMGLVTAKKKGDTQVTGTVSGFNGVCMVHVPN